MTPPLFKSGGVTTVTYKVAPMLEWLKCNVGYDLIIITLYG